MGFDSTGGIFAKAGRAAEFLAKAKSAGANIPDLSGLLGTGTNDPTGQNLPGKTTSVADLFKTLDTNGDGSLSGDEFAALPSQFSPNTMDSLLALQGDKLDTRVKKLLAAADRDKSGGLSLSELGAAATKAGIASGSTDLAAMVKGLDTDGNGELSSGEIRASIRAVPAHRPYSWQSLAGLGKGGAASTIGATPATMPSL